LVINKVGSFVLIMKVLFFASVTNRADLLKQKFYVEDMAILENLGFEVNSTNKIIDFIKADYDVAFLYFYKWSLLPAIISRLRRKKVYCTGGIDELAPVMNPLRRKRFIYQTSFVLVYFFATRINIVSASDLENVSKLKLIRAMEWGKQKIHPFPHSVNHEALRPGNTKVNHMFVTTCWMITKTNVIRKGLDKAFIFFSEYQKVHPEAVLFVLGQTGEGTEYLKTLHVYDQIKHSVRFTGYVEDAEKFDFLGRAVFYMQFSRYEGFGLAALEANMSKCYLLHSGSGGYLKSSDVWGKCLQVDENFPNGAELDFIAAFNYEREWQAMSSSFDATFEKYHRRYRTESLGKMILGAKMSSKLDEYVGWSE
jgi:glycosyltransferase involved in cell wall biosynthesis